MVGKYLRKAVAPASALLLCAAPGLAQEQGQTFAIKGAGMLPCSNLEAILEKDDRDLLIVAGWIQGFVSARNAAERDTFDIMPWQDTSWQLTQLARYCRAQPDKRLVDATMSLLQYLEPFKVTEKAELLQIPSGEGRFVTLYDENLRDALAILKERGHFDGEPVALWNDSAAAAFRGYQEDRGLKVTGVPDQTSLSLLLLSNDQAEGQ